MVIPFLTYEGMLFYINKKWKIVLVDDLKVATCQFKMKTTTKWCRVRLDNEDITTFSTSEDEILHTMGWNSSLTTFVQASLWRVDKGYKEKYQRYPR